MEEKKENTEIEKSIKSKDFLGNDKGVAVVEVILILVVLIALVIIFRDQIVALAISIWKNINGDAKDILN